MDYFGGGGVKGTLHPSLRIYTDCFMSPPFPKSYPRGGGPWDQDPILMRDFRLIREHEIKWKEAKEQLQRMKGEHTNTELANTDKGGSSGLGSSLEEYLEELGEDGTF